MGKSHNRELKSWVFISSKELKKQTTPEQPFGVSQKFNLLDEAACWGRCDIPLQSELLNYEIPSYDTEVFLVFIVI